MGKPYKSSKPTNLQLFELQADIQEQMFCANPAIV